MKDILTEIRKTLDIRFYATESILVAVVCCLGTAYTAEDGTGYSVIQLMTLSHETMLDYTEFNRFSVLMSGIGTWTQLILPSVLCIGYMYNISAERQSGLIRQLLIRKGDIRFAFSKLVSSIVSSGIVMITGFFIYFILVYVKFPDPDQYGNELMIYLKDAYPGFCEPLSVLKQFSGVLLYGICAGVFGYWVAMFSSDRYILICLPVMIKYVISQIISRNEIMAIQSDNEKFSETLRYLKMESVYNVNNISARYSIGAFMIVVCIYLSGFMVQILLLKKRKRSGVI